MRSISRVLLGALLALCVSHATAASSNEGDDQAIDPAVFRSLTRIQLDAEFEKLATMRTQSAVYAMLGPSWMDCESGSLHDGIETCFVRSKRPTTSAPAALSHY